MLSGCSAFFCLTVQHITRGTGESNPVGDSVAQWPLWPQRLSGGSHHPHGLVSLWRHHPKDLHAAVTGQSSTADSYSNPEGRLGISDITTLSGISGCHLIPLSYLLSCFSASSSGSFCLVIFLLMVRSPDFFPQKQSIIFHCELGFFVWLLLSSWEMIVGAIWHWYLPLCIYIFILFLLIFIFLFFCFIFIFISL